MEGIYISKDDLETKYAIACKLCAEALDAKGKPVTPQHINDFIEAMISEEGAMQIEKIELEEAVLKQH